MLSKLSENIMDKISMDYLRNQVLKNAYGNDDTIIAALDPRILLIWYSFFGIIPWFLNNMAILMGIFLFVAITTRLARVAPLVLFLFCLGVFSQTGYLLIVSLFFGGDEKTLAVLLVMSLKVVIVSLASITVFSGLDPDRLAIGMTWFKIPERFTFSIAFGYRILPIMMEEFQNILLSYKMRGIAPDHKTIIGKIKYLIYQVHIIILAFYPLMLNCAKRSRTTVEALELKGYRYASTSIKVRRIKLASLRIKNNDIIFVGVSMVWVILCVLISLIWK